MICCYAVTKSCSTLCDPMDCSMTGSPLLHYFPEFVQIHVHWAGDAIQPTHPLLLLFPPALSLSLASGSFPVNQLFVSGDQSIAASASDQFLQWIFSVDFFRLAWFDLLAVQGTQKKRIKTKISSFTWTHFLMR